MSLSGWIISCRLQVDSYGMPVLFSTSISVDLVHYEIVRAKVGKGIHIYITCLAGKYHDLSNK